MITFLLSITLVFIQVLILGISREFFIYNRNSNQTLQTQTEPITHQELIGNSSKLFLPDGTVHLAYRNSQLSRDKQIQIYDLNDNFLWQVSDNELPEEYLKWSNSTLYSMHYDYMISRINSVDPETRRSIIVPVLNDREIISLWRYN